VTGQVNGGAFTNVSYQSFGLRWGNGVNTPTTTFTVEISTNSNFSAPVTSSTTVLHTATFSSLSIGATYYARVKANGYAQLSVGGSGYVQIGSTQTLSLNDNGMRYWVASAPGNWSNSANWSLGSGGPGGYPLVSTNTLVFDSGSVQISTADGGFGGTISSITIVSGYTGTVFIDRSLTVTNTFYQTAGTINLSTQAILLQGNFYRSGGTFIAGGSTVTFYAANSSLTGSTTFYSLTFDDYTKTIDPTSTMTVTGLFTLGTGGSGPTLNGGFIEAKGDIYQSAYNSFNGTTVLLIDGTGNQTLSGNACSTCYLLPTTINKI
jgi:hypothetical protein